MLSDNGYPFTLRVHTRDSPVSSPSSGSFAEPSKVIASPSVNTTSFADGLMMVTEGGVLPFTVNITEAVSVSPPLSVAVNSAV